MARAEAVLRRTRTGAGSGRYAWGNVELDDDSYAVWVEGEIVSLSPTQYGLLRFMLRNRDRTLSNAELVSNVWGYEFDGSPEVVETYMSTLRRKRRRRHRAVVHVPTSAAMHGMQVVQLSWNSSGTLWDVGRRPSAATHRGLEVDLPPLEPTMTLSPRSRFSQRESGRAPVPG